MKTNSARKVFIYVIAIVLSIIVVLLYFRSDIVTAPSDDEAQLPSSSSSPNIVVNTEKGGNEVLHLDDLAVGESRVLTDPQIQSMWGGIDPQYSPDNAVAAVENALPQIEYEQLFPKRIGTEEWQTIVDSVPGLNFKTEQADYFSYSNLIAAITDVANIKYKVEYRQANPTHSRIYRLDKETKTEMLIYQHANFKASYNLTIPVITQIEDFGSFIKEGTVTNRKRELAAFLANISHETGGGGPNPRGGVSTWGLFWNEEIAYMNTTTVNYAESHNDFPPVAGKSYHGRGPIQLSWNYNYGLFSSIIYGTKDTLLEEPELIVKDGKLGFMTAILFWMTPQPPKPSAHDVMVGNWTPSETDITKGLTSPGFGITIMIINGNLEGNNDESDRRIKRRVTHYRDITARMGVNIDGEKLDTAGMSPF
ncbi:chitinase [Paenibacillus sp. L3-i20]|uniref:chitinase n=1 Tax=Paenibacillus sp. L3-i20 TaxID=2905833 RepID=UPI001EE05C6F|nr:chitinase [Paenibacillus sp. L3-i20]GKU77424.1 hypothetical protein L3i20_v218210 [Paenibacillus sp. L3-i20]